MGAASPPIEPAGPLRRTAFVDRDGTLGPDLHYLDDPDRLEIYRGVPEGLRLLRAAGFVLVCITNQSGVERGLYTEATVRAIHDRMQARLASRGAALDAIYFCPHAPAHGCGCRKPGTELFEQARREHGLTFEGSVVIGDRAIDVQAGRRLGLTTVLVPEPGLEEQVARELAEHHVVPDIVARSFMDAVGRILERRAEAAAAPATL